MGVLNKHFNTVPDNEDYNKRAKSDLLLLAAIVILFGIIVAMLSSCSYERKVATTYRDAERYSPITKQDSLNLIKASKKIRPEKPIVKKETIRVPYPVKTVVKVLDNTSAQRIADSLGIAHAEELNGIVDDCMSSAKQSFQKGLAQGIKSGYEKRNKELSTDSIDITPPIDTAAQEAIDLELSDLRLSLSIQKDSTLIYLTQRNIYKKQSKERLWILIVLGIGMGLAIFFRIKKNPAKPLS